MVKASSASACASIAAVARLGVGDELGDHRIVIERDFAAFVDAGIVAHGHAVVLAFGRRPIAHQPPDRRREVAIRILRIDAALDRPAIQLDVALLERSGSPAATRIICSTRSMPVTSSVTGCSTCRRVFISRKIEAPVLAGDELDSAGAVVTDGLGERDRLLAHFRARLRVEKRAGRFLDDFLVAALDRALAFAEIDRRCHACRPGPGFRRGADR